MDKYKEFIQLLEEQNLLENYEWSNNPEIKVLQEKMIRRGIATVGAAAALLIAAKDPDNYSGILMSLILPFGHFRLPASYSKLDEKKFNELKSLASTDAEAKKLTNQLKAEYEKNPLDKDKIKYLFSTFKKRMRILKKKSIREDKYRT